MTSLLERVGLRPRPFRALTLSYLLQDLRSQHFGHATATKPGDLLPPLFWVVGQYLIASGLLSAVLFMRVDAAAFAFAGLAVSFLLMAAAVVVEFHEIVLAPDDLLVVGHRPVPGRTYAAARLCNLAFFVLLLTLALNLVPAILGSALRDSGPAFFPAYLAVATLGNLVTVSLVILAYAWPASGGAREETRDTLAWAQIVLILLVFYGAQLMLRDSAHGVQRFFARPPAFVELLPPTWLGAVVARVASEGFDVDSLRLLLSSVLVTLLLFGLVLLSLSQYYRGIAAREDVTPSARRGREGPLVGRVSRTLAGSRPQAAVLGLALALLRRDGDLRMRTLPSLGAVLAFGLLGLASGQLGNPFDGDPQDGTVSLAVVQILVLTVPSMLQNMASSRDHEAAWLLETAPRPSVGAFGHAARLAVCWGIALPALAVLGVVFAVVWRDPLAAALAVAMGGLEVLAVGYGTLRALRLDVPFARPPVRGDVTGPIAPWTAAVATVGTALAALQYVAAGRLFWLAACVGFLVLGLVLARRLADEPLATA